jgi:sulfatase maturation enzyme AslB (radical SAM superfamily)
MDRIKRCIEATFDCPCNLKCPYCYLTMKGYHGGAGNITRNYDAKHIGIALSKERLGGCCFINVTGGVKH